MSNWSEFHAALTDPDFLCHLRDDLGLSDAEITEAFADLSARDLALLMAGELDTSKEQHNRIGELRELAGLLLDSRRIYPIEVGQFLRYRFRSLGCPLEALQAGRFEEVRAVAVQQVEQLLLTGGIWGEGARKRTRKLPPGMHRVNPRDGD